MEREDDALLVRVCMMIYSSRIVYSSRDDSVLCVREFLPGIGPYKVRIRSVSWHTVTSILTMASYAAFLKDRFNALTRKDTSTFFAASLASIFASCMDQVSKAGSVPSFLT